MIDCLNLVLRPRGRMQKVKFSNVNLDFDLIFTIRCRGGWKFFFDCTLFPKRPSDRTDRVSIFPRESITRCLSHIHPANVQHSFQKHIISVSDFRGTFTYHNHNVIYGQFEQRVYALKCTFQQTVTIGVTICSNSRIFTKRRWRKRKPEHFSKSRIGKRLRGL